MARRLDETDEKLLALLAGDGRSPLKTLAGAVGLSTSAVQERIVRLRADGEILGFTIRQPNRKQVVRSFVFVTTGIANCSKLAPQIAEIPEVKTFDSITGKPDMILLVEAASAERLQEIRDLIATMEHVTDVECKVSMKRRLDRS